MIMPQLDFERCKELFEKLKTGTGLDELIQIIKEEQGDDFEIKFLLIGLVNIEAARGFLIGYHLIREGLLNKSTENLESMFNVDKRMHKQP